jgi:hypothetical protein
VTIGIGAFGPRAGLAVYQALRAAELVGRGAIGGFATYVAITADGRLMRAETQRGGGSTLFTDGETTGVEPPEEVANAIAAAVISSGPDRPAPLTQFLPSDGAAGLVTGHRLPNAKGVSGQPINEEILALMRSGRTASEAVDAVLNRNANSDTGIIAVDRRGQVYARNTARVLRRPDLGHARREHGSPKAVVEVIHNAIRPYPIVATLAADVALATMVGEPKEIGRFTVSSGCPLALGPEDTVIVDDDLNATKIVTTDQLLLSGRQICAAIYLHSKVVKGGRVVGRTMFEPITTVVDGQIAEMSGQKTLRISFQADTATAPSAATLSPS